MSITFSPIVAAQAAKLGGTFSVRRLDLDGFGGFASPIEGLDHYRMSGPTFAPHPHAGFSAVSYVFEDSAGGLRNRDSIGHDFLVEPGAIVWTQAANGVVHEEIPAQPGREVHGIQLFVNLKEEHKGAPPQVFRLGRADVPEWRSDAGDKVRVVVGAFGGVRSDLTPTEPFTLLDVRLAHGITLDVPAGWDALLYVVAGEVGATADGQVRTLREADAVALRSAGGSVALRAASPAHLLILSGAAIDEPVVAYGPFIMTNREQIAAAADRYNEGLMGRLAPL